MSLAEEFAARYAGLRKAYGTFTANNETREDGKASGKNITISKELSDKDLLKLFLFLDSLFLSTNLKPQLP